jgi:hypothetical protein
LKVLEDSYWASDLWLDLGVRPGELGVFAAQYNTSHRLEFAAQGFNSLRLGLEAAIPEAGMYKQR